MKIIVSAANGGACYLEMVSAKPFANGKYKLVGDLVLHYQRLAVETNIECENCTPEEKIAFTDLVESYVNDANAR